VDADFHARFSATARHYLYRIVCRRAPLVLERGHAWHLSRDLDAEAMHLAAQSLIGSHDFTTFRAAECQAKSPVKTLDVLDVRRLANEIQITASARSFLHHQVRSIVGSLKLVGEEKWQPRDMKRALEAKDRTACGPVAPAVGLYLVKVDYCRSISSTSPGSIAVPKNISPTRANLSGASVARNFLEMAPPLFARFFSFSNFSTAAAVVTALSTNVTSPAARAITDFSAG
jgi:tRNA U38,U39,U40 pseudouridine synthase TruA